MLLVPALFLAQSRKKTERCFGSALEKLTQVKPQCAFSSC